MNAWKAKSKRMSRQELQEAIVFMWNLQQRSEEWDAYWKMSKKAQAEYGRPQRLPEMPDALYLALEEWAD